MESLRLNWLSEVLDKDQVAALWSSWFALGPVKWLLSYFFVQSQMSANIFAAFVSLSFQH